jgi:hypothetical protein
VEFCKDKSACPRGSLSPEEIRKAEICLTKAAQLRYFPDECVKLSHGQAVKRASALKRLKPYTDDHGLIRVGGRTGHHPYIIPRDHPASKAIVSDYHKSAHVGPEWTLSLIRQKFWLVKARPLVRKVIHECVTCKKLYGKPNVQIMSDLPPERVEAGKPVFTYVGIDAFGPLIVKNYRSQLKRYGCLFTCMTTRAVHIEKLNSMDADSFINAFRRFTARRGAPEKVFSDNGRNFVAAEKEMKKAFQAILPKIKSHVHARCIEWAFIPPVASHMGGAWERMVGLVKRVMKAILTEQVKLNDEILETFFCEIESIVNGRPLTKLSDDVNDPAPLTPNHLLLMKQWPVLPPGEFGRRMLSRRWQHVQHLADQFWRKWTRLYLPGLQKTTKWFDITKNVSVGDLVLIADENTPRNVWPLAVVREVSIGRDGKVRSVRVRTRASELVRPITKLIMLEGGK